MATKELGFFLAKKEEKGRPTFFMVRKEFALLFICHSSLRRFSQINCHSHFPMHLTLFPIRLYLYLSPPYFLCTTPFYLLIHVPRAKVADKKKRREYRI
jgi:hypothetical protein